ncbi:MAG TPA: helix-turn-helix domain-containing protein [Bryobacteraceae bacterium]
MLIRAHRPAAQPLAAFVEQFWYCEGYDVPHRRERVVPSGRFQLIIDLSESTALPLVVGMRSRYSVVDTAQLQRMMGIVFRAGGARSLLDISADEFYNREVPFDLVVGRTAAADLRDRLREAATPSERFHILEMSLLDALRTRAEKKLALHPAVRYALREFQDAPHIRSVLDVTHDAGLSRRRFAQLFREQIGLTPKLYCRLQRFQEVVQRIGCDGSVDWADVAAAGGYCDQSHLAHEFRAFSGLSPSAWMAHQRPFTNHAVMD